MGMGGLGAGGGLPGSSGPAGWTPPGARDRRRRRRRRAGRRGTGRMAVWRLAAGAGAVALAVTAGLLAGRPAPAGQAAAAPGVAVLVAARDLPAGAVPAATDLRTVLLPAPAVPADALPPAAVAGAAGGPGAVGAGSAGAGGGGSVGPLAVAMRRGDVLTGRLLGTGWAPAGALRAYTLSVGDGVEAGPLVPGDRVDVLAAAHGQARTVLRAAPVLRLVPGGDGRAALVVVGVTASQAEALAAARAAGTLTLVQAPAG
jgi:pilus assembly protein CpaB